MDNLNKIGVVVSVGIILIYIVLFFVIFFVGIEEDPYITVCSATLTIGDTETSIIVINESCEEATIKHKIYVEPY